MENFLKFLSMGILIIAFVGFVVFSINIIINDGKLENDYYNMRNTEQILENPTIVDETYSEEITTESATETTVEHIDYNAEIKKSIKDSLERNFIILQLLCCSADSNPYIEKTENYYVTIEGINTYEEFLAYLRRTYCEEFVKEIINSGKVLEEEEKIRWNEENNTFSNCYIEGIGENFLNYDVAMWDDYTLFVLDFENKKYCEFSIEPVNDKHSDISVYGKMIYSNTDECWKLEKMIY